MYLQLVLYYVCNMYWVLICTVLMFHVCITVINCQLLSFMLVISRRINVYDIQAQIVWPLKETFNTYFHRMISKGTKYKILLASGTMILLTVIWDLKTVKYKQLEVSETVTNIKYALNRYKLFKTIKYEDQLNVFLSNIRSEGISIYIRLLLNHFTCQSHIYML